MSYTSDNTSVILSDVQTMQDDIKSTLEEEASLITDWDISLKVQIYRYDIHSLCLGGAKGVHRGYKTSVFSVQTRYRSS